MIPHIPRGDFFSTISFRRIKRYLWNRSVEGGFDIDLISIKEDINTAVLSCQSAPIA